MKLFNIYGYTGANYAGNVYDRNGIAPTILQMGGGNRQPMIIECHAGASPMEIPTEEEMRYSEIELTPDSVVEPLGDCRFRIDGRVLRFAIRKLTPRECLRLMDVDEKDIDKFFEAGLSNSQIYRQAGNSICVSNLYHIFRKMFIDTQQEYKYGDQMQLF